jgi:hypothetical protein
MVQPFTSLSLDNIPRGDVVFVPSNQRLAFVDSLHCSVNFYGHQVWNSEIQNGTQHVIWRWIANYNQGNEPDSCSRPQEHGL